ncbi:MAG: substrate-binding domain-containing protein [Rhizobiales bacterium]|nr:substrate-binding domain-containing protein [Hyphomicrobiales bacterium]
MAVLGGGRAHAADQSFKIGISNGWVGSEWRTQMISETQAAAEAWSKQGVAVELVVQSHDADVQTQIGDIRNFINLGVNAVLVNPNSPTAFDQIFAEAKEAGVLVVATDGEVSSTDAYYVGIDQKEWAAKSARWLAEALKGKGNIVTVNGIAGHPANQARIAGYKSVFKEYPDIKILNEASGEWDQVKAQQVIQTLLSTYPNINGIWVQDGMAEGGRKAVDAAGRSADVLITAEVRAGFLREWKKAGWTSGASVNPPGCMASALNFAVEVLRGAKPKAAPAGQYGNAYYIEVPLIDNSNLDQALASLDGKPDYTYATEIVSPDKIREKFFA